MRASFRLGVALLLAAPSVWATTKGVKGIDIIVKKHPTGNAAIAVRTDSGGTARFSLTEPGEYEIEFNGRDVPPRPLAFLGNLMKKPGRAIEARSAEPETIAVGRIVLDANTERVRLAYPRIDLGNGIHRERITTFGPVDVMLRLTEEVPDPAVPGVTGLPRRLEFVAVEGGPAPARQTVPVLSDTGTDWQIQFAPVDRISASFSKPGGRLAPGASDTVDVTVLAVGLAPGVYKGQISILTASGGQTGEPAYIPLYLRVLPRARVIDPVVSRRTLVFADGADTQSFEVTNPNAVPQTYLLEAADATAARAVRITPAQLALQPGQSGRIAVSYVGEASGTFTLRLTPQGQPPVNLFVRKAPPTRAGCFLTELIPVLASVDPQIGEDARGTVEVYDNCGRRVRDVVVKVETESGASFFGINDGVTGVKVGASKTPPGKISAIAIAKDPFGGEITGSTGEIDLGGRALPALAEADKPFEITEIVDAATGEPGVIAPGAQLVLSVITKSSSNIKNNFPVPVQELRGQTVSIGDRALDIIGETEDGDPVVEVPTDLGPQFATAFQTTKSGIKVQPRAIAVAPAAPALITRANPDGTPGTQTPIYKMNGEVREDYALGGGAPPRAGEIIQVEAIGLGATDADGNVLGTVKLLMGEVEAKVLSVQKRAIWPPRYYITAEMPELKSLDGGATPAFVKVVVDDIESAEAITPPVEKLQTTKVKLKVSPWSGTVIYQVDGYSYSGLNTIFVEPNTDVAFNAPTSEAVNTGGRYRRDFDSWGDQKVNQFVAQVNVDQTMELRYNLNVLMKIQAGSNVSIAPISDGWYRRSSTIEVNGSCPSGQSLSGIEVNNVAGDGTVSALVTLNTTQLPAKLSAHHAFDFRAICVAAATVSLTVTTNPAGLGVRVGTTGSFTPGPITQQVPANQAATIATQTPQVVNGTGYTFTGWTMGGTATTTTVTPTANTMVTANFSTACHVLTINASGGTVAANPLGSVTGFQNNCYAPGTVVTLTATANSGNAFSGWAGDATGTTSPTTVTMTGPKSVTANFGAPGNVTINLVTVPAGLNVRFGANTAFNPAPFAQQVPANQSTTIEAVPTQVLNGTGYRFASWSTGATTAATTVQPTANLTATATYTVACHTLIVNTTGPGTVTASPQSNIAGFASNCYAPGTTVVLTANPNTGNAFTNWSGDASGTTSPTSITLDASKTVTATFGQPQNVTLTVTTNPAGLGVRIGTAAFAAGPVSQQVPANQSTAIKTSAAQVVNGTGYRFTNWSTGANTAATSVQPTANLTATANFAVACHLVDVTSSAGGTVALNPASGNVTGFPANCYAPGTQVRILATANTGFGLRDVVINASGSPSTVTTPNTPVTVSGPITAAATFIPRPGTVSTIFPPVLVSGNTYRDNVFFSNPTPTAGFNLRATNVTLNTTGGTGTVTLASTLPIVFGALPANGQSSTQQILFNIPATVTAYNIFVTVEVENANGDTFTNVVSVGQTVPVAQNVTLTVASNPAGLGVRIGASGPFVAAPVALQVPAGSSQTIAADTPQVVNGTGYRFNGWSTGANTAVATVQPNANLTATANFQAACHTVTLTGVGSGTVALNPAQSGITGFPANCFAPGSQVRLLATANTGFGVRDVVINNGGVPSTVTTPNTLITVNGPVVATATFIPRPATVSTIFPPVLVSGTTYRSNIFFSNPTPTPGSNLRIVNVTFNPTGGTGTPTLITALPVVFGALPANGQSSTQQLQFNLPATLTAYNIFVTVEVQNANGDTFTNVVSVGHTKP